MIFSLYRIFDVIAHFNLAGDAEKKWICVSKKAVSFDMDPIIVGEDTTFEEIELGDGEYAIDFQMTGTDGKTAMSEIELFRVKDGYMKYL